MWLSGRDPYTPLLTLISLLYGVYCAWPVFALSKYSQAGCSFLTDWSIEYSLGLACVGLASMLWGYYCRLTRHVARRLPRFALRWDDVRAVQTVALLLICVGFVSRVAFFHYLEFTSDPFHPRVSTALQQPLTWLVNSSLLGLTILFILALYGRLTALSRTLMWCSAGVLVLLGSATGSVYQGVQVGLLLLFAYSTIRRRIPWAILGLGFAALLILQPAKTRLRSVASQQVVSAGAFWRLQKLAEVTNKLFLWVMNEPKTFLDEGVTRLSMTPMFACVVEQTPGTIPYWNGYTYYPLLTKFVPRFLWQGKAIEDTGTSFPQRYGIVGANDFTTDVNLPQLIEAYINFGPVGVVGVMVIIGATYRLVQAMLIGEHTGLGELVAGVYIFAGLLQIETNASLVIGGIAYQFLHVFVVGLAVNGLRTSRRVQPTAFQTDEPSGFMRKRDAPGPSAP